jgi:AraC family carnitine catabolism transcriptional activator
LIDQAEQIMRAHIEEPVSVPFIADALGVHQRALERAFKAADMGTPLARYLDLRLGRAQELLTQTTLPMLEVALACGFGSPANFSRVFRRRFGLTPTDHRQRGKIAFELRFLAEEQA